jgi:hypothetical protein
LGLILENLAVGSILVAITVSIHGVGLLALSFLLRRVIDRYQAHEKLGSTVAVMVATVLGLFALHTIEIWVWAVTYTFVGAVPDFLHALTFSTLAFSTLGAEAISTTPQWQLSGSIEGVNGFLLIGWSTAYLIPAWTRYGPFHEERGF